MPNFCSLELSGHLGRDPELRYTSRGTPVCSFSVAYTSGKDQMRKTVWFDCQAWKDLAECIASEFSKGSSIKITKASPNLEEWTDRGSGEKRSRIRWNVWEIDDSESETQRSNDRAPEPPPLSPDDEIPF